MAVYSLSVEQQSLTSFLKAKSITIPSNIAIAEIVWELTLSLFCG